MSFKLTFAFVFTIFVIYNAIYNENNNTFSANVLKQPKTIIQQNEFYTSIKRKRRTRNNNNDNNNNNSKLAYCI